MSSPFWATVNLANTVVGTAFLVLPFAFSLVGLGPGLVITTVVWLLTSFTGRVLVRVAQAYQKTNYEQLAEFSDGWLGLVAQAVFQLGLTCTILAIFITIMLTNSAPAIAGLAGSTLRFEYDSPSPHDLAPSASWTLSVACGVVLIGFSLFVSCARHFSALKYTSLVGLVALLTAICCVAAQAGLPNPSASHDQVWVKEFDFVRWATALGIISFALLSHHVMFQVANSLPRPVKFDSPFGVFNMSMLATFVLSLAMGIIPYCTFGGDPRRIAFFSLWSYAERGQPAPTAICLAQLAIAIKVAVTYPAVLLAARHSLRMLLDMAYAQQLHRDLVQPGDEQHLQREVWRREVRNKVDNPMNNRSLRLRINLTVLLWVLSVVLGLFGTASAWGLSSVSQEALTLFMQFPGPISSAGLGFLLPALIHLRLGFDRDEERPRRWDCTQWTWQLWASAGVLLFGVVAMVAALVGAISATVSDSNG